MFRDPLAIEKCRLESILWARRIAGGGPGHIFYESDNEGFIVRCITDLHERRDRARASGLCSCGAERAPGYRLCPVCHGRDRDRQRRQVATSIAVGQCVRNGCVPRPNPAGGSGGTLTSTPSSSGAAAVRGLGRITADFSEPMPRPDLALAREGVRRRRRSTATTPRALSASTMRRAHSCGSFRVELSCILEALPSGLSAAGVGARGLHDEAERTSRRQLDSASTRTPRRVHGLFRADYTQRTHAWNL